MKGIRAIQTDSDVLKEVVGEVVSEQLNKQKEMTKRDMHLDKILKKNSIEAELGKKSKNEHDICPNCHNDFEKLDDTMKKCTHCGSITVKKDADFLICENCGGIIPSSYAGTNKPCPNCGGTKARKP